MNTELEEKIGEADELWGFPRGWTVKVRPLANSLMMSLRTKAVLCDQTGSEVKQDEHYWEGSIPWLWKDELMHWIDTTCKAWRQELFPDVTVIE